MNRKIKELCLLTVGLMLFAVVSCASRKDDQELTPSQAGPPDAYWEYQNIDEPYVYQWADFEAYLDATVEIYHLAGWTPDRAVRGDSIAISLDEGAVLANTSAHPQYFRLWLQIPADLEIGREYPLRAAARLSRSISREEDRGGTHYRYSLLRDGELLVSGMQGYDVPELTVGAGRVASFTLEEVTQETVRFSPQGKPSHPGPAERSALPIEGGPRLRSEDRSGAGRLTGPHFLVETALPS